MQLIMKDMVDQMLKGKNVIKLLIICLITSCSLNKINIKKNSHVTNEYRLDRFKSNDGLTTQIIFKCYDFENKKTKIPAIIIINNVYLNSGLLNIGIGKHSLKALFIGKKSINISNLIVKRGDSIVIKAYMKDNNTVFRDYN